MVEKKMTIPVFVANPPQENYPLPEKTMNSLMEGIKEINERYEKNYPLGAGVERNSYGFAVKTGAGSFVLGAYFTINIVEECITPTAWLFSGGEEMVQHAKSHAKSIADLFKEKTGNDLQVIDF